MRRKPRRMDPVTAAVRSMYERYPYPSRAHGAWADLHPGYLLSLVAEPPTDPITVLDAGCGTGMASLGTAGCNPEVQVTAADMNRTALERIRQEARESNLGNLAVKEVDLSTLAGLEPPEHGFSVIYSSGVLHHMADPLKGLRQLASVLARNGVMRVMVYGTYGRQGLNRFVEAADLLWPDRGQLEERLPAARRLMASLAPDSPVKHPPWTDTHQIDDVEFVDRYLNVHHRCYTVRELLAWISAAGLELLRWYDPQLWTLEGLEDVPEEVRWEVVERLAQRPKLDVLLVHPGTARRPAPRRERLAFLKLALNPQVTWSKRTRLAGAVTVWDDISASLRDGPPLPLNQVQLYALEMAAPGPIPGAEMIERLTPLIGAEGARELIMRFLALELLFVPNV